MGDRVQDPGGLASMASPHLIILLLVVALPAAAPRLYSKHASVLRAATRAAFFSLGTMRDPEDVQSVLRVRAAVVCMGGGRHAGDAWLLVD
jgi:hypothetical protein